MTRTGTTMGTLAYASPEQVTGRGVDRRSEIWSLGVVFYELLTGQLPFTQRSEGELVFAIMNNEPEPVEQLRPEVGDKVLTVLGRMLEKEPDRRYADCDELLHDLRIIRKGMETSTTAMAKADPLPTGTRRTGWIVGLVSAAVVVVAAHLLLAGRGERRLDPDRIVVDVIRNRSGDPSLDELGNLVASWVTRSISESPVLGIVPFDDSENMRLAIDRNGTREERADPLRAIARAFRSGTAVTGEFYRLDDTSLAMQLDLKDMRSGDYRARLEPIPFTASDVRGLMRLVQESVRAALALEFDPDFAPLAELTSQPPTLEAFAAFRDGLRAYFGGSGGRRAAIQHFYRASRLDSTYMAPLLWAARMHWSGRQGLLSIPRSSAEDSLLTLLSNRLDCFTPLERLLYEYLAAQTARRHYEVAVEAARLAPGTMWSYDAGQTARVNGYPVEALEHFAQVDPDAAFLRDWPGWTQQITMAHLMVGDYQEALDLARRGRQRNPRSGTPLRAETWALACMGRATEILQLHEESKALGSASLPGVIVVQGGNVLRAYGHMEEARFVYEKALEWYAALSRDDPGRYRATIGSIYYRLERFEEAWDIYYGLQEEEGGHAVALAQIAARRGDREDAERWRRIHDAEVDTVTVRIDLARRNQAAIAALLGERDKAVRLLQEAFARGLPHDEYTFRDPEFAGLRDHPPYQALFSYWP